MKKTTLFLIIFLSIFNKFYGQINPVQNLSYSQNYYLGNWFNLTWAEPELPHDTLLGYNIYRDGLFYRFQTENYCKE